MASYRLDTESLTCLEAQKGKKKAGVPGVLIGSVLWHSFSAWPVCLLLFISLHSAYTESNDQRQVKASAFPFPPEQDFPLGLGLAF